MATWNQAVQSMGTFYFHNIHTYQGGVSGHATGSRRMYSCPLLGNSVGDDCSGFTSACLQLFGAFPKSYLVSSHEFASTTSTAARYLKKAGFSPLRFLGFTLLQPFDIIARNGHVEVFYGKNGSSFMSYGWGNIHDGRPGPNGKKRAGMPCYTATKPAYSIVWRNSGVSIDTPLDFSSANGNTMQQQMNTEYGTGGTFNCRAGSQFNYTSNTYPVHDEYETIASGNGSKSVFEIVGENKIRLTYTDSTAYKQMNDSSVMNLKTTRIYSTNDSSMVLDELSIPINPWDSSVSSNTTTLNIVNSSVKTNG